MLLFMYLFTFIFNTYNISHVKQYYKTYEAIEEYERNINNNNNKLIETSSNFTSFLQIVPLLWSIVF